MINHFPGQEHLPSRVPAAHPKPAPPAATTVNPVSRRATALQIAAQLKPESVEQLLQSATAIDAFLTGTTAEKPRQRVVAGAIIHKALSKEREQAAAEVGNVQDDGTREVGR